MGDRLALVEWLDGVDGGFVRGRARFGKRGDVRARQRASVRRRVAAHNPPGRC